MNTLTPYVAGFRYNIGSLFVDMSLIPFNYQNRQYSMILYKNLYVMTLVRFTLTLGNISVRIYIPFYQSSGTNSSSVGAGTWFPFHCCSQSLEKTNLEHYYRSKYGDSYIFKMGHYFMEPFSGKCEDLDRNISRRELITPAPGSICGRQRNFLINHTSEIPSELMYPEQDRGVGVHTIFLRFGNLLYLTASYFLFGNPSGWNPDTFPVNSPERAFATVLNRISTRAKFADKSWGDIVGNLPRNEFDRTSYYSANTSAIVNHILMINEVAMPHYQDVSRNDNGLDARFITYMKLIQTIGELYLESASQVLWDRFMVLLNRAALVNNIKLNDSAPVKLGNDFYVWAVPEIFSNDNTLVKLYRFI